MIKKIKESLDSIVSNAKITTAAVALTALGFIGAAAYTPKAQAQEIVEAQPSLAEIYSMPDAPDEGKTEAIATYKQDVFPFIHALNNGLLKVFSAADSTWYTFNKSDIFQAPASFTGMSMLENDLTAFGFKEYQIITSQNTAGKTLFKLHELGPELPFTEIGQAEISGMSNLKGIAAVKYGDLNIFGYVTPQINNFGNEDVLSYIVSPSLEALMNGINTQTFSGEIVLKNGSDGFFDAIIPKNETLKGFNVTVLNKEFEGTTYEALKFIATTSSGFYTIEQQPQKNMSGDVEMPFSLTDRATYNSPAEFTGQTSFTCQKGGTITFNLYTTDKNNDPVTITQLSGPSGFNGSNKVTHSCSLLGTTKRTFKANDGKTDDIDAKIQEYVVDVYEGNVAPTALSFQATTPEDTQLILNLSCSDGNGNPLSYTITKNPAKGTLSGSGAIRTYTPAQNFNGTDSAEYKCNDGTLDSNLAAIGLTVTPVNDPASAVNVSMSPGTLYATTPSVSGSETVIDIDGNTAIVREWYDNGAKVGTGSTYSGAFVKGHTITYKVTADGQVSASIDKIVQDTPGTLSCSGNIGEYPEGGSVGIECRYTDADVGDNYVPTVTGATPSGVIISTGTNYAGIGGTPLDNACSAGYNNTCAFSNTISVPGTTLNVQNYTIIDKTPPGPPPL